MTDIYTIKKMIHNLTQERGQVRCQYTIDVNLEKPISRGGVNIKVNESLSS